MNELEQLRAAITKRIRQYDERATRIAADEFEEGWNEAYGNAAKDLRHDLRVSGGVDE